MTKQLSILAAALLCVVGAAILPGLQPGLAIGQDDRAARPEPASRPHSPGVTEEQEKELLAWLKDRHPEDHGRLIKLREDNPRDYRWALGAAWRMYQHVISLPPEMQKAVEKARTARLKAWRLSRDLRAADDEAQKQRLRKELTEALENEFDADQQLREYRLAQLEEQIKNAAAEVKDRSQRRAGIIEDNLNRLLNTEGIERPMRPDRGEGGPFRGSRSTTRPGDGRGRPHGPPGPDGAIDGPPPAPATKPA